MKPLGLNEIRSKFLEFYESKNHLRQDSFSLIPKNDKSLLIINSGMAPMKPYFSGQVKPPANRITTCQKCIRTADIENVGVTSRHGTFFEMLGSFSFGDYFKEESIKWGWEFIHEVLQMPSDRLWVSIYEDDDDAYRIWSEVVGFPESRIVRLGKDDNFWEIGTGPCGPCSEIYFDMGEEYGCCDEECKPGCDCDRYVEFWNHVFTQYNRGSDGTYSELENKNIDTGMGLERLACIMQGVSSIFEIDTISNTLAQVLKLSHKIHIQPNEEISVRIITDHIRSATFMVGDGIIPSGEGRGYVLRRLIRRAITHGRKLDITDLFLHKLVDSVVEQSGDAYPTLLERRDYIVKIIMTEEERFSATLEQGMNIINEYMEELSSSEPKEVSGEKLFKLHDTFGFPIDLTKEILAERGFSADESGFLEEMNRQREAARADAVKKDFAWSDGDNRELAELVTEFVGYEEYRIDAEIVAILEDFQGSIVLNRTPFYATGGGQESDIGYLIGESFRCKVVKVEKIGSVYIHHVDEVEGEAQVGMSLTAEISRENRNRTASNHTATHLLHNALRAIVGSHVDQAGSKLSGAGLRFDFHHYQPLTRDEIISIENMVNQKIISFLPVDIEEMPLESATANGAVGLFEDSYSDIVRVVTIDDVSMELCGGTHVENTGMIGGFKIKSESGIASGVRRIEAITSISILEEYNKALSVISEVSKDLKTDIGGLKERIQSLQEENRNNSKELERMKVDSLSNSSADLMENVILIEGIELMTAVYDNITVDEMRSISDSIKEKSPLSVLVLASKGEDKVTFLASITDAAIGKGLHAGKLIKEVAALADGGGGGKANMAQAGGKKVEKTEAALAAAEDIVKKMLKI